MEGTTVPRDDKTTADVAAVMALEQPVRELLAVFKAANPALKRLEKAAYPGGEWLREQVELTIEADCNGGLNAVIKGIHMLRAAKGSPVAFDYEFFVRFLGVTPDELITENHIGIDRGYAVRQYAASVA
jgi:hypothetical protein